MSTTYEEEPLTLALLIYKKQAEEIYNRLARYKRGYTPPVDLSRRKYVGHAASSLSEYWCNGASQGISLPENGRPHKVYRRV